MGKEKGWKAKLVLTVKGPDEGAVVATLEYEDTSREMATGLQDKLAELGIALNKK